jgi:plasmid stability protein
MPSLTIKELDSRVLDRLRSQAKKRGTSLNGLVKEILQSSVGLAPGVKTFSDFAGLAGTWTAKDAKEFEKSTRRFEKIDPELWK